MNYFFTLLQVYIINLYCYNFYSSGIPDFFRFLITISVNYEKNNFYNFDFRGVVFDIDPVFANSEDWYESIPEDRRPQRDQPFYHLLAENAESSYVAYVSQQNLVGDGTGGPVEHPSLPQMFEEYANGRYRLRRGLSH